MEKQLIWLNFKPNKKILSLGAILPSFLYQKTFPQEIKTKTVRFRKIWVPPGNTQLSVRKLLNNAYEQEKL